MKKTIVFTILLLLSSCASREDRRFIDMPKEDLVEAFDLSGDQFQKFKVDEITEEVVVVVEAEKKEDKKDIVPKEKETKEKKKPSKKVVAEKKVKAVGKEARLQEREKKPYPKDFPERFKKYDKKYKKYWKLFTPTFFPGEKFVIEVRFLGILAGYLQLFTGPYVKVADEKAYHIKARLKSAKFYEYIYSLDDSIESYLSADDFLPIKYTLRQRESGQSVDDLQLFDTDSSRTYFWYKRLKEGKEKKIEKNEYIPRYFQDSFSALYFVRGFPLNEGDIYEFPIVTRAKIWLLKVKVKGIEEIKYKDEWLKAIKVDAETHFPGVLKKKGDITFWYSADKVRKLLKFEAKVKIGSLEGELVDYEEGRDQ